MQSKITERSLMPTLSNLLRKYGFNNISEVGVKHGYFDFECFYKDKRFIVEIKIGRGGYFKNLLRGITQAWNYCEDVKGDGILVIEYPVQIKTPLFITPDLVENLASKTKVDAIFLSRFFNESFSTMSPAEIFLKLHTSVDNFLSQKETKTSFKLIIEVLRSGINSIAEILRAQRTEKEISELINTVVGRFDLFLGFGQVEKTKEATEKLKLTAIDLIPYLLSNQILFYHIFSETTGRVSKMNEEKITSIRHLLNYFKEITDINYKAIYSVDLVSELPDQKEIVDEIKEIIKAINILKPELVKHDLLGRLYHELLPPTTRKNLAAFYTNPVAANILAGLTIDKWDNTVIDPSCGSGTLLVAAYKRKLDLYKQKRRANSLLVLEDLHKEFVEEQITGIDIMPFASHLTAVNLSAQMPRAITNKVRVACQDSLELQGRLILPEFTKGVGTLLEPFKTPIQKALFGLDRGEVVDHSGVVSPEGRKGKKFLLKPVDAVIMNPPFSDREKMPKRYIKHLKEFQYLINKCGNQVNFWGFFLAFADYLLKENGKMGLVIPINIARGKATQKIRNYILENYHIQYVLKTTQELAFSEGAAFRDILFIAEKRKPKKRDLTEIIFLKKSIKEIELEETKEIVKQIKETNPQKDYIYCDDNLDIRFVSCEKLLEHKGNLMKVIGGFNSEVRNVLDAFMDRVKLSPSLTIIQEEELNEGFGLRPAGISSLIMITRPFEKSRMARSTFLLNEETKEKIEVSHKLLNKIFFVDKSKLRLSFRSITGVKSFDISEKEDYIIIDKYPKVKEFQAISRHKGVINWSRVKRDIERIGTSNIAIPNRINLSSPNTHIFSVFSKRPFIPVGKFFLLKLAGGLDKQKAVSLFLNSICMLAQAVFGRSETTGAYFDIKESDYINMFILNFDRLSQNKKHTLVNLFEKLKDVRFPSIVEQLENRFPARISLDKTTLKILGFSDKEISEWLPKVYDALVEELGAMKSIK
ncbi:MAG: HsdM family class I SAM-dependent methyltransferase [Candidatus Heimdallarchaeaceae archaeon]